MPKLVSNLAQERKVVFLIRDVPGIRVEARRSVIAALTKEAALAAATAALFFSMKAGVSW